MLAQNHDTEVLRLKKLREACAKKLLVEFPDLTFTELSIRMKELMFLVEYGVGLLVINK